MLKMQKEEGKLPLFLLAPAYILITPQILFVVKYLFFDILALE